MVERPCPYDPKETQRDSKERGQRNSIVTAAAQCLLDRTDSPANIRAKLYKDLRDYYGAAYDENPEKIDFTIAKYSNKAFRGAFSHLAGNILISSTLPLLHDGRSFIPHELSANPNIYQSFAVPNFYEEPFHTYMGASTYWWQGAHDELFSNTENTDNPYNPLLIELYSVNLNYKERSKIHQPARNFLSDLKTHVRAVSTDNVMATMLLLHEMDLVTDGSIDRQEMTKRALSDAATLSWAATVKRDVLWRDVLKYNWPELNQTYGQTLGNEVFEDMGYGLREEDGHVVFRQRSLKDGPWAEPRACAGILPLKPADEQSQANTQEFYTLVEQQSGTLIQQPNDGTFDVVKTLLTIGAYIARDTLFAHRDK